MDAELEFAIQPNTIGKQLFDQVSGSKCTNADFVKLLSSKKLCRRHYVRLDLLIFSGVDGPGLLIIKR